METKIAKYFELNEKDNCVYFIGDKLDIYVPEQYINDKKAIVTDKVQAFGCMDLLINESIWGGIHLPSLITFTPVKMNKETMDDRSYLVCTIYKGGKFLESLDLVQDNMAPYYIFLNFISYGRTAKYITYDNSPHLFDDCKEVTGKGVPVDKALWEIIMAYLYRDPDKIMTQYRHSPMIKKPWFCKLKDVSHAMNSTHTRLFGSYSNEGLNSSLLNTEEESHEIENLFRQ